MLIYYFGLSKARMALVSLALAQNLYRNYHLNQCHDKGRESVAKMPHRALYPVG